MKLVIATMTVLLSVSVFAGEMRGSDEICYKTKANEARFAGKSLELTEEKPVSTKETTNGAVRR